MDFNKLTLKSQEAVAAAQELDLPALPADAEAAYRRALSMRPRYRDAQAGLGDVLLGAEHVRHNRGGDNYGDEREAFHGHRRV